jgi:hypothetical protein
MYIGVNSDWSIQLERVFVPIVLLTEAGETLTICMRDSGFEFTYQDKRYSAKEGVIEILNIK